MKLYQEQQQCMNEVCRMVERIDDVGLDKDLILVQCLRKYAVSPKAINKMFDLLEKTNVIKIEGGLIYRGGQEL